MNPLLPTIFNFLLGAWGVAESTGLLNTLGSANGKAGAIAATVISFGNMFAHAYSSAQPGPFMSVPSNPGRTTGLVLAFLFGFWIVDVKAADLKTPAQSPSPFIAAYDPYTGFGIGAKIGYGFNLGNTGCAQAGVPCDVGDLSAAPQGFVGGVFANYGWRIRGMFAGLGLDGYFGLEGDANLANLSGNSAAPSPIDNPLAITSKDTWLAGAYARFGLIYKDVMFFGKVGEGWGGSSATLVSSSGAPMGNASTTQSGISWGGGVEFPWFFGDHWLAKVEYTQYDFGTLSVPVSGAPAMTVTQKDRIDTIMAGLKYNF